MKTSKLTLILTERYFVDSQVSVSTFKLNILIYLIIKKNATPFQNFGGAYIAKSCCGYLNILASGKNLFIIIHYTEVNFKNPEIPGHFANWDVW